MYSPQHKRTYNNDRDMPLDLRCINKLVSGAVDATVPSTLKESIVFKQLIELSAMNPLLLRDLD